MNGRILGSRYEIIEKIGEGGMSVVYKAKDVLLNRIVAVKVLREQYSNDQEFKERFRREACSVANFSHPNIVNVFDVGEDGELSYIVMELIDGEPLNEIIKREGMLDQDVAVLIIIQVLDALAHAHSYDIVHRDVKPHNIIVNKDGTAKITDFGIAKATSSLGLTETGTVMGTVNYTSPEQAKGKMATSESDLYSLGIVLYEMLTGKTPFSADTQVGVAIQHVQEPPIPPSEINAEIEKDLERVLLKALAKEPSERWEDARFFKAALLRTTVGESVAKNRAGILASSLEANNDDDFTKKFGATGEVDGLANGKNGKKAKKLSLKKSDIVMLVVIFLVICAVTTVGIITYRSFKNWISVEEVVVPDVVGMSVEEAQMVLNNLNLKVDVLTRMYDPEIPENHVISQNPLPNERKKVNSTIRLEISLGTEFMNIPDFTGLTQQEILLELESYGLRMGMFFDEYSNLIEEGRVMAQKPEPFARISKGSVIDITMSRGPEPIMVPFVIGMNVSSAMAMIGESGFEVGVITNEATTMYAEGTVISQSPKDTEVVEKGISVHLIVAVKPKVEDPPPQVNTSTNSVRSVYFSYTVPSNPEVQEIIIRVIDTFGVRDAYSPTIHYAGDFISITTDVYGNGRIEVLSDGVTVHVQQVENN